MKFNNICLLPLILLCLFQLSENTLAKNDERFLSTENSEKSSIIRKDSINKDIIEIYINDKIVSSKDVHKKSTVVIEVDTSTGNTRIVDNKEIINSPASAPSTSFNIFGAYIPFVLVSAAISALITFIMYFLNRRNAKKQIKFDLALKNLLPEVYVPLLQALREYQLNSTSIDFYKIKKIIFENMIMLEFASEELKKDINSIYILCNQIRNKRDYDDKEDKLVRLLEQVEKNITKRFGALKG